jgi:ribosomal protein L11 methyltransferase
MAWRQFVMNLGVLDSEAVEAVFQRFGASSVTLTDAGGNPVLEPGPGQTPLWADTKITGMFSTDIDLQGLQDGLLAKFRLTELPPHHVESLEDRAWEREWLKDFGPMQFGERLWILPNGSEPLSDDCVVIYLDPGLAFGTGSHATTALCLEWLDGVPLEGKTILDYGCGSGILTLAALKLGCHSAVAMDIDPQAVIATRQNANNNKVAENLIVLDATINIEGKFDVVVANILAGPLVQFAESITLTLKRGGMLTMSGVLCEQADDVMAAYGAWVDFDEPAFREQDGQIWSRLNGKRRAD